jgi:glyoxylase-like metal-dependent hydrolase (beta-lactamase superfamily II)
VIDVRMHGRPAATAAYLVRGSCATALVDTGPASSLPVTAAALERLGVERLDWIVLTHVHLDHAGACGALAARYPDAQVAVHRRGARHVVDPTALWDGVSAVYGDLTESLWGRPVPVAAERVVACADGDTVDLGDRCLRAVETVGHARHHHAWLDERDGDAFVGDAVGMQAGCDELWRASTPPADFDLDLALASIARLRELAPRRLWLGHFGLATFDGADQPTAALLDEGARTLRAWVAAVASLHSAGLRDDALAAGARGWLRERERAWPPTAQHHLDATSDPAIDAAGVVTSLEQRAARAAGPAPG